VLARPLGQPGAPAYTQHPTHSMPHTQHATHPSSSSTRPDTWRAVWIAPPPPPAHAMRRSWASSTSCRRACWAAAPRLWRWRRRASASQSRPAQACRWTRAQRCGAAARRLCGVVMCARVWARLAVPGAPPHPARAQSCTPHHHPHKTRAPHARTHAHTHAGAVQRHHRG
jgi:hypothetical protein